MNFSPEFFLYLIGSTPDPLLGAKLAYTEARDFVRFDTDADFECKRLVCFFNPDDGPQTEATRDIPDFNFNIRDNATGRTLFNNFVSTAEVFGDGRVPFVLPTSHFFKRGGQAQMLYDPVNSGPTFGSGDVWLGMIGSKHFEKG